MPGVRVLGYVGAIEAREASRGDALRWFLPTLLLVVAALGIVALFPDLDSPWNVVIWLPAAAIVLLRIFVHVPAVPEYLGIAVGAVVLPVFALVGVDWVWAQLTDSQPPALLSMLLGAVIVGLAAYAYLRPWWLRRPASRARPLAVAIAVILVIGPVVVFAIIGLVKSDGSALDEKPAAVSRLEVIVVRSGGDAADRRIENAQGWQVSSWVGRAQGDRVAWGAGGAPPAVPEQDADRVLLLMPDGDPEDLTAADELPAARRDRGEVARWMALADAAASAATPTFALLRSDDVGRLSAWRAVLTERGRAARVRGNDAVALQEVEARSTTDLALRLAVHSPTADSDLSLAAKHRPALFFDSGEPYPVPLNVDRVLASGKLKLCDEAQPLRTLCSEVDGPEDIHNRAANLSFDPDELAEVTEGSTIYVNVTRSGNDHRDTIYLDYWWYFPNNPTGAAGGALCGAGFVIAGVTCFDHESDWEGVTVVLDASDPDTPTGVSYAHHDGVTRYSWDVLQRLWDLGDRGRFGEGIDTTARPLVFVAKGTHASYPTSCSEDHCEVGRIEGLGHAPGLKEQSHDGERPWSGNVDSGCAAVCLAPLPTRAGGTERARWNAFAGRWGSADCVLGIDSLCSSSRPPRSPGFQDRYSYPWCAHEAFALERNRLTVTEPVCVEDRIPPAAEIGRSEGLLALGDSFSSGQGAGSYERGTTGRGNTCFRSHDAWPLELARELELDALPSLACSGALIDEVIASARRDERERSVSQVSRIDGNPGVITITIGGNDAGFADVLAVCVIGDCVRRYRRPDRDLLDIEVAKLARRLPGVYRAIRDTAPRARVVVAGYPRLFPRDELSGTVGNCAAGRRIDPAEVVYINSKLGAMNAAIAGAASAAGVEFVDVTEAFDGRELRCDGPTYMNRLRLPRNLFPASFHPNAEGHERLADVVADAIGER